MSSDNFNVNEEEKVFESIKTTHLIYPSSLITFVLFLITLFTPYYHSGFSILPFLPAFISYVFSYLLLFLIIYAVTAFTYREKAVNMKIFSPFILVYGFHPLEFNSRLGVKVIDYIGIFFSITFGLMSLILSSIKILFPGFLLLLIIFVSSIIWGSVKPWEFRRRT